MQKFMVRISVSLMAIVGLCLFSTMLTAQAVPGDGGAPAAGDTIAPGNAGPIQDNTFGADNSDTLGAGCL